MTLLPARNYTAAWRPDVRTTKKEVQVYVIKRAIPPALQNRRKNVPEQAFMLIGTVDPKSPSFDEELDRLVEQANQRAESLSAGQNAANEYEFRMAMLMRKRWKWILGAGVVIGMALPDIPLIPIL